MNMIIASDRYLLPPFLERIAADREDMKALEDEERKLEEKKRGKRIRGAKNE